MSIKNADLIFLENAACNTSWSKCKRYDKTIVIQTLTFILSNAGIRDASCLYANHSHNTDLPAFPFKSIMKWMDRASYCCTIVTTFSCHFRNGCLWKSNSDTVIGCRFMMMKSSFSLDHGPKMKRESNLANMGLKALTFLSCFFLHHIIKTTLQANTALFSIYFICLPLAWTVSHVGVMCPQNNVGANNLTKAPVTEQWANHKPNVSNAYRLCIGPSCLCGIGNAICRSGLFLIEKRICLQFRQEHSQHLMAAKLCHHSHAWLKCRTFASSSLSRCCTYRIFVFCGRCLHGGRHAKQMYQKSNAKANQIVHCSKTCLSYFTVQQLPHTLQYSERVWGSCLSACLLVIVWLQSNAIWGLDPKGNKLHPKNGHSDASTTFILKKLPSLLKKPPATFSSCHVEQDTSPLKSLPADFSKKTWKNGSDTTNIDRTWKLEKAADDA